MRFTYDHESNSGYLELEAHTGLVTTTKLITDEVLFDMSGNRVVGIELLNVLDVVKGLTNCPRKESSDD